MNGEKNNQEIKNKGMNRKKTVIISVAILLAGALITFIIFITEPKAAKEGATKKTAMLVDIVIVKRDTYKPWMEVTGTVVPSKDIMLSPRVSGEVFELSEAFIPGGFVKKGEVLLKIDPADYRNTLQLRKSELHQAEADLEIELGRQDVARKDYQLIEESISEDNKSLVLREPQLNTARSRVEAARAAVDQAELDLQRTTIRAPFNAHILSRNVNVGSQVSPGEPLGRLVGMDNYWVETTVPLSKLPWLLFPDKEHVKGAEVKIRNRTAWREDQFRTGYLLKMIGALENRTRLARVLVNVPDPMSYYTDASDKPALIIGAFVEAQIQAREIRDVVRLRRDYIRKNEKVWVMKHDTLQIRDVDILFRNADHAFIGEGLAEGDSVVTTNLSTVAEGVRLRLPGRDTRSGSGMVDQSGGGEQ